MPEGVKWRGHSVYRVLKPLKDAGETSRALFLMEQAAKERITRLKREAKEKLIEIADELKGLTPDDVHLSVFYECATSPSDKCIYNVRKDPWKDRCLFCGEPEDRG